jgi:AmmeMemoRadiSam system protein A
MDRYTELARKTVETLVKTGETILLPTDLPAEFYSEKKGVFVTIHKTEEGCRSLRGCIGTLFPTRENVAEEIIQNAVWAGHEDDRFPPVAAEELLCLDYEVSLLNEPQRINSSEDLDPSKYGVIVKTPDGRTGLLLPDIEGVDSPLQQIEIAARKGRIDPRVDAFSLWRFTVTKYAEIYG